MVMCLVMAYCEGEGLFQLHQAATVCDESGGAGAPAVSAPHVPSQCMHILPACPPAACLRIYTRVITSSPACGCEGKHMDGAHAWQLLPVCTHIHMHMQIHALAHMQTCIYTCRVIIICAYTHRRMGMRMDEAHTMAVAGSVAC